jgi:hypothetical protein
MRNKKILTKPLLEIMNALDDDHRTPAFYERMDIR